MTVASVPYVVPTPRVYAAMYASGVIADEVRDVSAIVMAVN